MLFSSNSNKISGFIQAGKAEELRDYLAALRNADFRVAGRLLGEKAMWAEVSESEFWRMASVLVVANNRAYLGTMLKACQVLKCSCQVPEFAVFASACITDIDKKKALEVLLPMQTTPNEVARMLSLFGLNEVAQNVRANLLFHTGTAPAYFLLFKELQQYEDQPAFLRRYAVELIRKGDKLSFNLASILQQFFALEALPGSFSLSIPTYELSRLTDAYDSFKKILTR